MHEGKLQKPRSPQAPGFHCVGLLSYYIAHSTPRGPGKLTVSRSVFSVAHPMLSLFREAKGVPAYLRTGLFLFNEKPGRGGR
jgi:hypothetical protein